MKRVVSHLCFLASLCFVAGASTEAAGKSNGEKVVQSFEQPNSVVLNEPRVIAQLPESILRDSSTTTSLPSLLPSTFETSLPASLASEPSLSIPDLSTFDATTTSMFDWETFEDLDELTTATLGETKPLLLSNTPLPPEELDRYTSSSKEAGRITLIDAICRAIQCNQQLRVEKIRPEISNTSIESAEGAFDTTLEAGVFESSVHSSTLGAEPKDKPADFEREEDERVSRNTSANIGLSGRLPSGTNYSLSFETNRGRTNSTLPFYNSSLNLGITQNLLRGRGSDVNCIQVWTAQNNFIISLYQLQQAVIDLVTDVQLAYWDLYLALVTLDIRVEAYRVAIEQRERTEEFVRVGKAPPLEALSAQAEESARVSDIIIAVSDIKQRQLNFLRLINPDNLPKHWETLLFPAETPVLPREELNTKSHLKIARYYRPDLRQAQIDLSNGELEVHRTANGLLPVLDFVTEYSLTGSGDTFGTTLNKIGGRDFHSWRTGFVFSYPLQNRTARASYRRANFQRQLAEEAINNFCEIIDVDIRSAMIEIERTARLIASTEVTLSLRREELAAEIEKFRVGRSTQLLVAQAQRDLTQAQLNEISAKIANIRAYINLYQAEGSTLQRCGIQPVQVTAASGVPRD